MTEIWIIQISSRILRKPVKLRWSSFRNIQLLGKKRICLIQLLFDFSFPRNTKLNIKIWFWTISLGIGAVHLLIIQLELISSFWKAENKAIATWVSSSIHWIVDDGQVFQKVAILKIWPIYSCLKSIHSFEVSQEFVVTCTWQPKWFWRNCIKHICIVSTDFFVKIYSISLFDFIYFRMYLSSYNSMLLNANNKIGNCKLVGSCRKR